MLTMSEIQLTLKSHRSEKTLPGMSKVWDYLEKRGISRETADACGLLFIKAIELIAAARRSPNVFGSDDRIAVVFPHWRYAGRDHMDWWSCRLVSTSASESDSAPKLVASFGDLVDPSKKRVLGKMFCPPNEAPHGYIPRVYDWDSLKNGQRVYIHESAIKSINGAVLGCASVGLNGVWGWKSRKHEIAIIPELRDLPWKGKALVPVIVFDSNAWTNWGVQAAESALAAKLYELTGQRALSLRVPKPLEGEDQGFDDYRALVGDKAAREWLEQEGVELDVSELNQRLIELNSEVCVVRSLGRIAEQASGTLMSRMVFTDVNYAHYTADVGDDEPKIVNVPKLWLGRAERTEVESIVYEPGEDRLWRDPHQAGGLANLNIWQGMGVDPEPGDVDPWLTLLADSVGDESLRQWIIAWLAYPLQNLGAKANTLLLMFGPQGTGKNLFLEPLHRIYGENAVTVDTDAIRSQFTSLYAQRQFIHADELVRAHSEEDAVSQRVKALVTSEKLKVNMKGQPEYTVANHANLAITSNYWDCLKLDQDDRRVCAVRWGWEQGVSVEGDTRRDIRGDQVYWQRYVRWVKGAGPSALYAWLLDQDITWFDPAAWAPGTRWKEEVTEASRSPVDSWIVDLMRFPQQVLPLPGLGRALWTAKELCSLYYGKGVDELTPGQMKGMANALRRVGAVYAHEGKLIRPPGRGEGMRYWVIQNRDKVWNADDAYAHFKVVGYGA